MKKGFTLIEMLVTVSLFAIIITIAVGGFTNAERTQRQVSSLISAQSNVSLALEQMSRDIRTGYLFCHDPGVSQYSSRCDDIDTSDPAGTTCTVASSSDPDSPVWTCPSLDFYDANYNEIKYSWAGGALTESVNSSTPQSITGNAVYVKYLKFQLFGQTEGDHWPPRITISLGIAASSTDTAVMNDVFNLETTVSARTIDCVPGADPAQC
ncbi:MAG: type II secretion system protein [Minisyncoccia bacterium]|jgi:prepilin-type N-terminal cleavage/methylation domain-containing protein